MKYSLWVYSFYSFSTPSSLFQNTVSTTEGQMTRNQELVCSKTKTDYVYGTMWRFTISFSNRVVYRPSQDDATSPSTWLSIPQPHKGNYFSLWRWKFIINNHIIRCSSRTQWMLDTLTCLQQIARNGCDQACKKMCVARVDIMWCGWELVAKCRG